MQRVPEVIDVWFDSGAMPFAQHHFPFEHECRASSRRFPADFICEAQDQTRGWFYSLLAVATLLDRQPPFEGQAPYRNVVCLGLILDEDGQKMSKSNGNTVEPWQVLDTYGADAFRWYFFTSKQPWDGYRFSEEAIGEGVRLFLKQLWSTYFFYVLYARAGAEALAACRGYRRTPRKHRRPGKRTRRGSRPLGALTHGRHGRAGRRAPGRLRRDHRRTGDRRARRRAVQLVRAPLAAALLGRRARRVRDAARVPADGRQAAGARSARSWPTRSTTTSTARLPACTCATSRRARPLPARDQELEQAMALARETVRLGLGARGKAKIKVRQPLGEAVVVADGRERVAIERLAEVVREELNVRQVRFVAAAEELGSYEVKANYRTLGPAVRQGHAARGGGDRGARPGTGGGGGPCRRRRRGRW